MAWYNDSWSYRKKITVDNTKVAADADNFPVYVDLSDMGSNFHSNVDSNGDDIRITESDGTTELPLEVVAIDTSGETGEVHFKASGTAGLSGSSDTDFYIYYGNASASAYAATDTYGAQNVWNSNYKAVWHLQESSGTYYDSTANNNDGADNVSATNQDGKIGSGQAFDGSNDYIDIPNTFGIFDGSGNFTVSLWGRSSDITNSQVMWHPRGERTMEFDLNNSSGGNVDFYGKIDGSWYSAGSASFSSGTWFHAVGRYNSSNGLSLIVDNGTAYTDNNTGTIDAKSNDSALGYMPVNTIKPLDGNLDEVRILNVELSTNWISTEYNNQNSPSTFYTIGSQETGAQSYSVSLADSLAVSDSVARTLDMSVSLSDNFTATDITDKSANYSKSLSDSIAISDSIGKLVKYFKSLSDSISLSDAISAIKRSVVQISDSIKVSDTIQKTTNFVKTLSDSISVSDSVSRVWQAIVSLSDSIKVSDTISKTAKFVKTISDKLKLTDAISIPGTWWRWIIKHTSSWTGKTKHTSSWTGKTKHTSSYTYKDKH